LVDVALPIVVINVSMKRWTEQIRENLGLGGTVHSASESASATATASESEAPELSMHSSNKAIYFCSAVAQDLAAPNTLNKKATQFLNANANANPTGKPHVSLYGPVVWSMLHGSTEVENLVKWDERITSAYVAGCESRRILEDGHEATRRRLRGEFLALNRSRAARLLPHLKRACLRPACPGGRPLYAGDEALGYLHALRHRAEERSFPSERRDPYEKPGEEAEAAEELKKGEGAFPDPKVFRPWWVWNVTLATHAERCGVGCGACRVPFCGEARMRVGEVMEGENLEIEKSLEVRKFGGGGKGDSASVELRNLHDNTGSLRWKEKVHEEVTRLQEEWHLDKEDFEEEKCAILGTQTKMDPMERKKYILTQLKHMGRMLKGFFGARDAASQRRSMAGAEGVMGYLKALEEESSILKQKLLLPDRRFIGEAMGLGADDSELDAGDLIDEEEGGVELGDKIPDDGVKKSSLKVKRAMLSYLLGKDGAVPGVDFNAVKDENFLGNIDFFKWFLSKFTVGKVGMGDALHEEWENENEKDEEKGEGEGEEEEMDEVEKGLEKKLKSVLRPETSDDEDADVDEIDEIDAPPPAPAPAPATAPAPAPALDPDPTAPPSTDIDGNRTQLGSLKFDVSHVTTAIRIPHAGCFVLQINQDISGSLVVQCTNTLSSTLYKLVLTQDKIDGIKEVSKELKAKERRPELAVWISRRAGRLFHFQEINSSMQLCLASEGNVDEEVTKQNKIRTMEALQQQRNVAEEKRRKLQRECRVVRLDSYRTLLVKQRKEVQRHMLVNTVKEWQGMDMEDVNSRMLRSYQPLQCDKSILREIEMAFGVFDHDGNGYISSGEFQALCFEMGEVMSDKECAEALARIGERAKRASIDEDENTRDESREMVTDGYRNGYRRLQMATSTTKLTNYSTQFF